MTTQTVGRKRMGPREVSLSAVMIAATAALTMLISIPFPLTRGYFNLGDAMVMLAGLLLGPWLGGVAGGVGSAIADVLLGFGYFAPMTLFIKGTEGFLTGLIGRNRKLPFQIAGVIAGAIAMLVGYFSVETPLYGIGAAIAELVGINILQVTSGAIISLILIQLVLRAYPAIKSYEPPHISTKTTVAAVVIVAIVLSAIVGFYVTQGISP
jgi:uncharacterized membrane protein